MRSPTKFYLKNTYDVPSSVRHPKNTQRVILNLNNDVMPYNSRNMMTTNVLNNAEMNTNGMNDAVMNTSVMNTAVMNTAVMNYNNGYLNKSHQVQKKPQHKQKTSIDADANQPTAN
jgi:hypothetical protein